ncbi:MAG: hypothetical protein P8M80_11965 [Pirellulaceae bacterium]|nr:hypothetical protein [Pirellulaceae bacterium]
MAISYRVAHNGGLITEEIKDRAKLYSATLIFFYRLIRTPMITNLVLSIPHSAMIPNSTVGVLTYFLLL